MSGPRLTLLLPVKGRVLHALRLLWHSNRMRIPHRFLIADGEAHPTFVALLKRSAQVFPNLDVEHVVYVDEGSFSDFYRRTADAIRRVSTPYVMNCGDDDFVLESGLPPCMDFLDARRDYACCGGGVAGFFLAPDPASDGLPVVGPMTRLDYPRGRYYVPRDVNQDSALERTTIGYADYLSSYHNVFRTDLLAEIYREIEEQDFSILPFRETYQAMRTFASGKVKTDPTIVHYLRQQRQGSAAGGDLVRLAFRPQFAREFEGMVARLTRLVVEADGVSAEFADSEIRDAYAEFFRKQAAGSRKHARTFGATDKGDEGAVRQRRGSSIRHRIGAMLWPAGPIPNKKRSLKVSAEKRAMFRRLSEDGAMGRSIDALKREFDEVERTLQSGEFLDFVRAHASELTAEAHQP